MMLSRKNSKREREQSADLDWHIRDLRTQLADQAAFVESKCECECTMLRELNEFFRKRAEIEATYARSLEKLARAYASRQPNGATIDQSDAVGAQTNGNGNGNGNSNGVSENENENENESETQDQTDSACGKPSRRASATGFTTYRFWSESVASARKTAADHASLGDLFERAFAARCLELADSAQRAVKRWRTALNEAYDQTVAGVSELQQALRAYHSAFAEYAAADAKLTDLHARGDRIATQLSLRMAKRKFSQPSTNVMETNSFVQRAICGASSLPAQAELDEQYTYSHETEDRVAQIDDGDLLDRVGTAMQKKVKAFERELEKKQSKCGELRLRAIRTRNEYVLGLEACNAQLLRLQQDWVADLTDALHVGYHCTLQRLATLHASAERALVRGAQRRMDALRRCAVQLDARADRRCVLRHSAFARMRQFQFQPAREDERTSACLLLVAAPKASDAETNDSCTPPIDMDAVQRAILLKRRIEELRVDADDDRRLVEMSENCLIESLALPPAEDDEPPTVQKSCRKSSSSGNSPLSADSQLNGELQSAASLASLSAAWSALQGDARRTRADRMEHEQALFDRFRTYLTKMHTLCGAQAKFTMFQRAMREQYPPCARLAAQLGSSESSAIVGATFSSEQLATFSFTNEQLAMFGGEVLVALLLRCVVKPPRSRSAASRAAGPSGSRPRVFGTPLTEYAAASGELVPTIVVSCVRVLAELGIRQQGLFRVSGAQTEIAELRALFDRGVDPLAHVGANAAHGVNVNVNLHSVACLLKAYLRELGERGAPLFGTDLFDELIACADADQSASVARLAQLATRLPHPVFVTSRFLFAFLSHVAQYASVNMMDSYNLAVCFAPTLMPVPRDRDPVRLQAHAIEIVKTCIEHHNAVFPSHVAGPLYRPKSDIDPSAHTNANSNANSNSNSNANSNGSVSSPEKTSVTSASASVKRLVSTSTSSSDGLADHCGSSNRSGTTGSLNLNDASTQTILMDIHYDVPIVQCARAPSQSVHASQNRNRSTRSTEASTGAGGTDVVATVNDERVVTETEWFEARVDYDYDARSEQECSLRKGEVIRVFRRVSEDWYEGVSRAHAGLIAAAYVTVLRRRTVPVRSSSSADTRRSDDNVRQPEAKRDATSPRLETRCSVDGRPDVRPTEILAAPERESVRSAEGVVDMDAQASLNGSKVSLTQLAAAAAANRGMPLSASKPSLSSTSDSCAKLELASSSENCSKISLTHSDSSRSIGSKSLPTNAAAAVVVNSLSPVCNSPLLRKADTIRSENIIDTASQLSNEETSARHGDTVCTGQKQRTSMNISFDEIQDDIDAALAEVMSGLESLERQQRAQIERESSAGKLPPAADAVLPIPLGIQVPFGGARSSLADVFATTDQPTLRRNSPSAPANHIPNANACNQPPGHVGVGNQPGIVATGRPNAAAQLAVSAAASPKIPPAILPKPKVNASSKQTESVRRFGLPTNVVAPNAYALQQANVAATGAQTILDAPLLITTPSGTPVLGHAPSTVRSHEHHGGLGTQSLAKSSRLAEMTRRKTTALTLPITAEPERADQE